MTPSGPGVDPRAARLDRVIELVVGLPDAFRPSQYANPANTCAHEPGTMAEIDEALKGRVDVLFVAASSTGTLGGCLDRIAARGCSADRRLLPDPAR